MNQHNGLTLAYIGDAYLELTIRHHLIQEGLTKPKQLHERAITYISTKALAKAAAFFQEHVYNELERSVFLRGRNSKTDRRPRNADLSEYHQASGFEAVIGYLYLDKQQHRLDECIHLLIKMVEEPLAV